MREFDCQGTEFASKTPRNFCALTTHWCVEGVFFIGDVKLDYAKRYRLMCPGPVNVSERVLSVMTKVEIGHREEEFSVLLREIRHNWLTIMGLPEDRYAFVAVTGSGSAANEAVLTSAIGADDVVLSLGTGEFGNRLGDISKIYNPNTILYRQDWATPLDLAAVENILKTQHVDWVTMVHHETSTGELQPVEQVGALCAKYGARLFVDCVSSFMADPLDLQKAHVSIMTTSSGKAIGMAPGLGLVVGERAVFEHCKELPVRNYYLSLARHYDFYENKAQTPNTPAILLLIALNEALRIILEEGVDNRFAFQAAKVNRLREGLAGLGMTLLHPDHVLSNAVSSVVLPKNVTFNALREGLRERGFIVYSGKGPLLDTIFQISTMGAVDLYDVDDLLAAIAEVIR